MQLYVLQDEVSPLIKEGKGKTLIIQFYLHLLTSKQWLADFKIMYILATITANIFHEV